MLRWGFPAGFVLTLLLLMACDAGDDGSGPDVAVTPTGVAAAGSTTCTPERPHAAGETRERIDSGGTAREYLLNVPPGYDGATALPIVIGLHGLGEGAEHLSGYTRFREVSSREGFIFVAPDALGLPVRWNALPLATEADDVAFLTALLDSLEASLCVDASRVYAAGYSNGGGMTQRLACDLPDRIAAVGIVAGVYGNCESSVPIIAFHGMDDALVPFEGGVTERFPSFTFRNVRRALSEWGRAAGCDGLPVISQASASVELSTFGRCTQGDGAVLLYSVIGGGHTWPGTEPLPEAFTGTTTQEIVATDLMWEFFQDHRLQ